MKAYRGIVRPDGARASKPGVMIDAINRLKVIAETYPPPDSGGVTVLRADLVLALKALGIVVEPPPKE